MKQRFSWMLSLLMGSTILSGFGNRPAIANTPIHATLRGRSPETVVAKSGLWYYPPGVPVQGCTRTPKLNLQVKFQRGQLTLGRFRGPLQQAQWHPAAPAWMKAYLPSEEIALAHPTNFGERFTQDLFGRPAERSPLIVIHETVSAGWQTVKFFQTAHPSSGQASYHALVKRDGTIFYLVPPDKRAFGAGDSTFGSDTIQTFREYPSSVNNFAYHVSLVSPPDGRGNGRTHSGYTERQYVSLAWLLAKTGIPQSRFTTHKAVDRSGSRSDPRSFDQAKFLRYYQLFPKTNEIQVGCQGSSSPSPIPGAF